LYPDSNAGQRGEACVECDSTNIQQVTTGIQNQGNVQARQGAPKRNVIDSFQVEIYDRRRGISESKYLIYDDAPFISEVKKEYPWLKSVKGSANLGNYTDGFLGLHYLNQLETLIANTGQLDQREYKAKRPSAFAQAYKGAFLNPLLCWRRRAWLDREVYEDWTTNAFEMTQLPGIAQPIPPNTKLVTLFPDGLANSSGHLGKHLMTHIRARVQVAFDDRYVNVYMGPSAQKHTLDEFNADNFDHKDLGFIRGAQVSIGPVALEGGPIGATTMNPPPGVPRWGAAYRDFFAKYYARHTAIAAQIEDLPYAHQTIDLDPNVRDAWGLPAPRLTYDWRRPNELKRTAFVTAKMEELGRAMGGSLVWKAPETPGSPGGHHEGGTRMGSDPKNSVVNKYGQSWDISNLFMIGSSTFPSMSGFNPTLTIQALAYMSADAIVNRYRKSPGPLV